MRFFWDNFPLFLIWLIGFSMLSTSLHYVVPPIEHVAWLALIPLITSFVLLGFAQRRQHGVFLVKRYLPWVAALGGVYVIPFLDSASIPLSKETHLLIYEASALIEFILLVLHGRVWLKRWDWAWVFGVTFIFGVILENGGIAFGFFREEGYCLYLPGLRAPVATMLGWTNVLYCCFFAVEKILPPLPPVLMGLACTVIGLSMDLPFDPVATRLGWWVWNEMLRMSMWGVPVINFVAWFWALFPYAWCYEWMKRYGGVGERKKLAFFSVLVPVILVIELAGVLLSLVAFGDKGALEVLHYFFSSICC